MAFGWPDCCCDEPKLVSMSLTVGVVTLNGRLQLSRLRIIDPREEADTNRFPPNGAAATMSEFFSVANFRSFHPPFTGPSFDDNNLSQPKRSFIQVS